MGCDGLVSIPKGRLTDHVGALRASEPAVLFPAVRAAVDPF